MERKCVILVISDSKRVTTYDPQNCPDDGMIIAGNRKQGTTGGKKVDSRHLHSGYKEFPRYEEFGWTIYFSQERIKLCIMSSQ
jgi:hypothetical protein